MCMRNWNTYNRDEEVRQIYWYVSDNWNSFNRNEEVMQKQMRQTY